MKMKRSVVLVVGIMLLVGMAPAAFADHCQRCRAFPLQGTVACVAAINFFPGYPECWEISDTQCEFAGEQCVAHGGGGLLPLATEFTVASVERLDEPATAAGATLVAAAALPQPTTR
jgi:hypothetical protein